MSTILGRMEKIRSKCKDKIERKKGEGHRERSWRIEMQPRVCVPRQHRDARAVQTKTVPRHAHLVPTLTPITTCPLMIYRNTLLHIIIIKIMVTIQFFSIWFLKTYMMEFIDITINMLLRYMILIFLIAHRNVCSFQCSLRASRLQRKDEPLTQTNKNKLKHHCSTSEVWHSMLVIKTQDHFQISIQGETFTEGQASKQHT